jgi:hypothetical protein
VVLNFDVQMLPEDSSDFPEDRGEFCYLHQLIFILTSLLEDEQPFKHGGRMLSKYLVTKSSEEAKEKKKKKKEKKKKKRKERKKI